jgi:hypothetical protein
MKTLKPLPTGFHTFRDIINGGFLYVDKTRLIYELIRSPKGVYFLARPRRFGKSLLISTLEEIFLGNRVLFQGLWLYDSPYTWEKHPVIRIDFSQIAVSNAEELKHAIKTQLGWLAEEHRVALDEDEYHLQFVDLVRKIGNEKQVVVLIDEYDKPLINNLHNLAEAQAIRQVLKSFYGVLKGLDRYLRFLFLTGVSKFSRVGVFSDLNNLDDLTMQPLFATLPGLTAEELTSQLHDHLTAFAEKEGQSRDALVQQLADWYDGFCFAVDGKNLAPRVYNPYSTMLVLKYQRFANYWFDSGTPTFLINLLRGHNYRLEEVQQRKVGELAFSAYELENLAIVPLLYQTGYLTIKGYDPEQRLYELGYPNREVEDAFLTYILGSFSNVEAGLNEAYLWQLIDALRAGNLAEFFAVLTVFFAQIPYTLQVKREKYYQTIFYLIFTLIGLRTTAEVTTNRGRIDAVVEVANAIYIFEFKLNGSAEEALTQIKTTTYYERYQRQGKPLRLVGVNFSTRKRGVAQWVTG